MQRQLVTHKVINALRSTYRSIDIRAAVAKSKDGSGWKCIFAKMRLTADERSQIEEIHKKNKKDLHIKNNANFRLLAECRDIQQLDCTLQEIEAERISIQGRSSRFITPQIKALQNLPVQKYDSFSTYEERAGLLLSTN